MRYFIMLAFLFWTSFATLYAQNVVYGQITGNRGEILGGAHIHVADNFATADPQGYFSVSIPRGSHRFLVSYVGYVRMDTIVQISSDLKFNVILKQDISQLSEVIVTERTVIVTADRELKRDLVERYSNESIGDLLREIPGVSSLKSGTAVVKPIINGLHSSRVVMINNNVRMEDHQWGVEHAPNVDVNSAGSVSLVKGSDALRYGGDAIGGVVVVAPQNIAILDTLYGHTILNGATNGRGGSISSALFRGYASGWNYKAMGTYKFLGDRHAPDYNLSNTGNREQNASASVGFKGDGFGYSADYSFYNTNIGILRASHIGNITDLVSAINNATPDVVNPFTYLIDAPRQQVAHHLAKLSFYQNLPLGKLSLQYAFQFNNRKEYDIRRSSDRASLDLGLATHSVNADVETSYANSSTKYGISAQYQNNSASIETGVRPLIPNYSKLDFGAYFSHAKVVSDKLRIDAGVRYDYSRIDAVKFYLKSRWETNDYEIDFGNIITGDFGTQWRTNPVFDYHNFSGSAGLNYSVSSKVKWITNISIASRNPNPSELFSDGLHHSSGQIELGDLRLSKEVAYKFSSTAIMKSDKWLVDINPYFNVIDDFINIEPRGLEQSIRGAFPVWVYTQSPVRIFGLDASAQFTTGQFSIKSTGAFTHGTNLDTDAPLIGMPPVQWGNEIVFNRPIWHNFTAGIRSEAIFYQSRFPNDDFTADVFVDGQSTPVVVAISRPPAGYHLLHFNTAMRFDVFNRSSMRVAFNVHNIMNTNYRDYLNRNRFYADDIGRNFTIQIKINY